MSMDRFDYNIVLSLVILLYLEHHQHEFYDFYRQVFSSHQAGVTCLFFAFIDLVWLAMVYDCWLFTSPTGKNEGAVFQKQLIIRWIVAVCALASCLLKVDLYNQIIIGIGLLGSRKATEYTGYAPLESGHSEPHHLPPATNAPSNPGMTGVNTPPNQPGQSIPIGQPKPLQPLGQK